MPKDHQIKAHIIEGLNPSTLVRAIGCDVQGLFLLRGWKEGGHGAVVGGLGNFVLPVLWAAPAV